MSVVAGRLHLHLGPPKTGTTSLQIAAQSADLPWLVYGGTSQPRDTDLDSLSRRLHAIARGDIAADSSDGHATRARIDEVLSSGFHLFVSEEMFLVTQTEATFQEKLFRLALFLKGVPVSVLLTLRDPVDALPSYYQEIYHALPLQHRLNFATFCRDDRAQCFDYATLVVRLRSLGFNDIRFLTFREIASGFIPYAKLFGTAIDIGGGIQIGAHNVGMKDQHTGTRVLPAMTIRSLLGLPGVKRIVSSERLRATESYRWLADRIANIKLLPSWKRRLEVPNDLRKRLTEEFAQLAAGATDSMVIPSQP